MSRVAIDLTAETESLQDQVSEYIQNEIMKLRSTTYAEHKGEVRRLRQLEIGLMEVIEKHFKNKEEYI